MKAVKMDLKYMQAKDREFVMGIDPHVSDLQFEHRVYTRTGYVIWDGSRPAGLMHYTVLWDHIPFLNLIYVKEAYRNRGIATEAMKRWEEDMKNQGYQMVLISTQVDEEAQHLYRKAGYTECGALLICILYTSPSPRD